jgi:cell division protein FtsA
MIKATDRKLVVGLEIGTAKVAALVGEVLPDGMVNIIGVGSCPSRGMDKGGVNDLESVVKCVPATRGHGFTFFAMRCGFS